MKCLIQTVFRSTFIPNEIIDLEVKYPHLDLTMEENKICPGEYYIFQEVDTMKELDDLVADFGCHIVYGDMWEANGTYYPVIEIYDQMRE
jgi:hypothetical protein